MGYSLKVDIEQIKSTKDAISNYKTEYKNTLIGADSLVAYDMSSAWKGDEYTKFKEKWDTFSSSPVGNVEAQLDSYYSYLECAYNEYNSLQSIVKDKSSHLPR